MDTVEWNFVYEIHSDLSVEYISNSKFCSFIAKKVGAFRYPGEVQNEQKSFAIIVNLLKKSSSLTWKNFLESRWKVVYYTSSPVLRFQAMWHNSVLIWIIIYLCLIKKVRKD